VVIAELRRLLAEGTPGPWQAEPDGAIGYQTVGDEGQPVTDLVADTWNSHDKQYENAALIVAAVNALPRLLDVVEAARERDLSGFPELKRALAALAAEGASVTFDGTPPGYVSRADYVAACQRIAREERAAIRARVAATKQWWAPDDTLMFEVSDILAILDSRDRSASGDPEP
jgi:hypothetical protein